MGKTVLIGDAHAQNCPFDWEKRLISGLPINDVWLYRELEAATKDEEVDTIIWSCSYPLMGVLKYEILLHFIMSEVPIEFRNINYKEIERGFYNKAHPKVKQEDYHLLLINWLDRIEDFATGSEKVQPLPLAAHYYSWKLDYSPHAYNSLLNRGIKCCDLRAIDTYEERFYENEYGVLSLEGWEAIRAYNDFV